MGVRYVITKFSRMYSLPNLLTHCDLLTTVEPVLSSTVLSGHPLIKWSVFKDPKITSPDVL